MELHVENKTFKIPDEIMEQLDSILIAAKLLDYEVDLVVCEIRDCPLYLFPHFERSSYFLQFRLLVNENNEFTRIEIYSSDLDVRGKYLELMRDSVPTIDIIKRVISER